VHTDLATRSSSRETGPPVRYFYAFMVLAFVLYFVIAARISERRR
jgi:hypothetical protein